MQNKQEAFQWSPWNRFQKKGKDLKNQSIKSMKGGPKTSSKGCAGLIFFCSSRNEPTMTRGYRWQGTSSKNKTRWCALSSPSLCLDFSSQWRRWKWRREFQERIGVDHYITNLSSSKINVTLPNFFLLCFSQRVCSWRRLFTISPVQGVFALTVWAQIAEAKIDRRE